MLSLPATTKVFLFAKPCDMRKGFDGLFGLIQDKMNLSPMSGYLFVFMNRNRTLIKILYWDNDGLAIYYKRLEKGTFKRPTAQINAPNSELSQEELYLILRGIYFEKTLPAWQAGKKRKRFLSNNFVS